MFEVFLNPFIPPLQRNATTTISQASTFKTFIDSLLPPIKINRCIYGDALEWFAALHCCPGVLLSISVYLHKYFSSCALLTFLYLRANIFAMILFYLRRSLLAVVVVVGGTINSIRSGRQKIRRR